MGRMMTHAAKETMNGRPVNSELAPDQYVKTGSIVSAIMMRYATEAPYWAPTMNTAHRFSAFCPPEARMSDWYDTAL
jgi:hypothetical protein